MKKFLSMALVLIMVLSMATVAFADEWYIDNEGKVQTDITDHEVTVAVSDASGKTIYNVTIEWQSLEFVYQIGAGAVWQPGSHTYDTSGAADHGWVVGTRTAIMSEDVVTGVQSNITVINHSNAAVYSTATYADGDAIDGSVTDTFGFVNSESVFSANGAQDPIELKSAALVAFMNTTDLYLGNSVVYAVQVNGVPTDLTARTATVGTVKIAISTIQPNQVG